MPRSVLQRVRLWRAPRIARRYKDADWLSAPIVKALVRPGDSIIDVGANMGYITARLAEYVGSEGRVYALEPVPDTFDMLERTVRTLGLKQVSAIHAGASHTSGTLAMSIPRYADGLENLYEARMVPDSEEGGQGRLVRVRTVALDDLIRSDKAAIRFVKIDVEGHERATLEGAKTLLERDKPALLIEVSGNPDDLHSSAADVFELLGALDYQAFLWDGKALKSRKSGDFSVDYFFLQPSHLQSISEENLTGTPITDLKS